MLKELRVRNLAVIESATAPFAAGLNVLTGETGAGKSILVDAITLLLGERAQPAEAIRSGAETATIEGVFALPRKSPVAALLQEHGIPLDDGELVVRRELVRGGRGRVFLNDASATLGLLERVGEALVEVHGQHDHQVLLRPARHLDLVDAFAGLGILRERLRQRHEEWRQASGELEALQASRRDRSARVALHRADLAEIDGARLRAGEEEELREERRRLQNAERLAAGANAAYQALYDDPGAALARAGQAAAVLRDLLRVDAGLAPAVQALEVATIQLDEAVRALRSYRTAIVFDPPRLEAIEHRLDEIGRLKRRHGESVEGILALRARLQAEVDALEHGDEDEARLQQRQDKLRAELITRAADLAERREQAIARLEAAAAAELAALDLEGAVLRVRLCREPAGEGDIAVGPEEWRLGPRGVDQAEFLFSANPGEEPKPLARIASGGELSRTMLALKAVLAAADGVPVLVFDEVDAGIGGRTADAVGRKLRQVARTRQVLCITHLPQIAAYADQHLRVDKTEEQGRTAASVTALAGRDRVREVARMLGGESVTDTSLRHALELIQQARGK
jgi:DNA repair protein RecN (Recombination protein N)